VDFIKAVHRNIEIDEIHSMLAGHRVVDDQRGKVEHMLRAKIVPLGLAILVEEILGRRSHLCGNGKRYMRGRRACTNVLHSLFKL